MKKLVLRFGVAAVATLISLSAWAQTSSTVSSSASKPSTTVKSGTSSSAQASASHTMKKEDFEKRLNEIQPKLNDFNAKAKENASKNPEFSTEVNKLTSMVNTFKGKVDKYDSQPKDQQQAYSETLHKDWHSIREQEEKVEGMWHKMHPEQKASEAKPAPTK